MTPREGLPHVRWGLRDEPLERVARGPPLLDGRLPRGHQVGQVLRRPPVVLGLARALVPEREPGGRQSVDSVGLAVGAVGTPARAHRLPYVVAPPPHVVAQAPPVGGAALDGHAGRPPGLLQRAAEAHVGRLARRAGPLQRHGPALVERAERVELLVGVDPDVQPVLHAGPPFAVAGKRGIQAAGDET